MGNGVSMLFESEEGEFRLTTTSRYQCSCIFGGYATVGETASLFGTAYRHHYYRSAIGNPSTYTLDGDSQGRRCAHSSMTWQNTPSPELSNMTDSGLYYSLLGNPVACSSVCAGGKNGNVIGPSGPILGAASCD
jgi:hypothetical protein